MNWSEVWEEIRVLFKFAIPLTIVITGLTILIAVFVLVVIPTWAAIIVGAVWIILQLVGIIILTNWVVEKNWV